MTLNFDTLKSILSKNKTYLHQDGTLNNVELHKLAQKSDNTLIDMLASYDETRLEFFLKRGSYHIFLQDKFIDYISHKDFLADSYTKYKNKIGLHDGKDFIKKHQEIVLSFPFKDCILEGGQTKDEETRKEIYYNKVLAAEEIDRLLDAKVFTNAKRYFANTSNELDSFHRDAEINKKRGTSEDTITDNLIIKGNNLIALHSIKNQFRGKIKLIYIDPPYNTGNDSFKYNDNFNHSTWLVFMKNRLEIARELLRDDGVIFVQCDDNEQAYLKVLMDEVFGIENFVNCIVVKMSTSAGLKMSHKTRKLLKIKETLLVFTKESNTFELQNIDELYTNKLKYETARSDKYIENFEEHYTKWYFCSLHQAYQKHAKSGQSKLDFVNENYYRVFNHVINNSTKKAWNKLSEEEKIIKKDKIRKYNVDNSDYEYAYNDHVLIPYNPKILDGDMWFDNYSIGGTKSHEGGVEFNNGKKREILLKRIISIATKPGDIVLDFCLGSGTTCAVAHKMGRQYIGIEQMDYIENIAVERLKKVIEGEQGGISKSVEWGGGGGSFIYLELKKHNQRFLEHIEKATSTDELITLQKDIIQHAFIDYRLNLEAMQEEQDSFKALSLVEQKQVLCDLLDYNQMYVNYSEQDDICYECSSDEKHVSKDFYQHNKNK